MKKLLLLTAFLLFSSSWVMAQTDQSSATPPGGMQEIQAYSIFLENYKGESYENAIKFGRWIWKGMPEKIEGYSRFDLKRNLNRLINSYSGLGENVQDPSLREAYVDTALMIFDKMFEKYPDNEEDHYDWHIKRGRFLQTHSSTVDDAVAKAAESYRQAYELKPEEFTKRGDGYYMRIMLEELIDQGEKDQALAIIKKTESYAPADLQDYYDDARNELFDTPEERITFLEGELEEEPENEEILNQLRNLYQDEGMSDKAIEISQKLYEINSNFENTMAVAEDALSNANYDRALQYLKEALAKAEENEQKAEIALEISDVYLNQENLTDARQYAREAINYDDDWGDPYIQIADIYAEAVSECSSDRKLTPKDKAVYWLVLDYLEQAKAVDQSTANEVSRKYDSYEPVTPSKSEQFFWDPPLNEGDEMEINADLNECYGWISETTTVR
jgi:tetratricopeptide (TPR) repeat protein